MVSEVFQAIDNLEIKVNGETVPSHHAKKD
jgi:hypothetical protein